MKKSRFLIASTIAATFWLAPGVTHADEEFGANTPYYEDDAWYDVSEWFDGNDYNPTDEAIGRWDDERFQFSDNLTSSDQDSDDWFDWDDYGYANDTSQDNRWFYDYYDDGYGDWSDTSQTAGTSNQTTDNGMVSYRVYSDFDDDGLYDAYSYYTDSDNDGVYEGFNYYAFDSSNQQANKDRAAGQSKQKEMRSQPMQITGTVDSTKRVQVRDRDHLVAHVKTNDGKTIPVDLGRRQDNMRITKGDQLTATGHRVKIGDKPLLIATSAQSNDADFNIDRNGRKYSGEVVSTHEVTIRGQKHLMAKIKTEQGKSLMVDLGAADQLSSKPNEGNKVTVQGVPVKVKDRIVLMARTLEHNGDKKQINRSLQTSS